MDQPLPSLGISVYDRMRTDILWGRFRPGAKLRVHHLAERYACGASPVREALNQLVSIGLARRIDRRGFYVAPVSVAEFEDVLQNRCFLEGEALRRSIAAGDAAWEEGVVLAHYRLMALSRTAERTTEVVEAEWEAAHKRFHLSLLAACGSPILLAYCDDLYDRNIRYRYMSGQPSNRRRDAAPEHDAIAAAVLARDAGEAVARLEAHYRKTGAHVFGDGDPS